ncbi:cation diffusion facilitator family transporter [Nostoc sp. FACHB-110]|uniref:cation diffusion facilitator family transporter n=1 Tax=Nostoc sp. FACHB-110 TaxID=2692834 RepID=UPI0016822C50|nr:cation diffusion facilitator family transporter [Nostoc sp. FACHB-110]MBD2438607.1 cation transporter [Nostoc sp. FACHB-110]
MQSSQVKQKFQALWTALVLLSVFFCVELSAGIWSHSLSLLADAEHILSDVAALGLAIAASWLSQSISKQTIFARYRPEILAALINGLSLACIAAWIVKEALVRLQSPEVEILGVPMLTTALIGLGINSFNALYLHGCSHQDLNIRGVFLHILADIASSIGAVLAAIAVLWLNWTWADGVISLVVAVFIALFAAYLVIESVKSLRGQINDIAHGSCMCNLPPEICSDRTMAEKTLFPSLEELIK